MKKTAITLAFILTLCSFTACGDKSGSESDTASKSVSSSVESSEVTTEAAETETEAETTVAETEETTTQADEEEETAESDDSAETGDEIVPAAAENTNFKRGKVEGNVYTSEYSGLKLTAPEGWTFANDDYILALMNMTGEKLETDMLDQLVIFDAVCVNPSTGQNLIIEYDNLAKQVSDPDKYTVEDYLTAADSKLSDFSGVNFTRQGDIEDVTLGGQEFKKMVYIAEKEDGNLEQISYTKRLENFMLAVIISNNKPDDDMTALEKNFEAIS